MIRALILRNLRDKRLLLAALVGGVFGMAFLLVQIASAFETGPGIVEMFNMLPPVFRNIFGVQIDELSFAAFVGFGFQHPAVLAMGLALVVLIASTPAAERESGLLELLLAHPLPRARYLTASLLCMISAAVLLPTFHLLGTAFSLRFVELEDKPSWTSYAPSAFGQATLLLAFGGVTLLMASGASRRGPAASRAVGLILVLFVIDTFSNLYEPFKAVSWLSLFHYFRPIAYAVSNPSPSDALVLLAVFAVSSGLAFVRFTKRDV